MLNLFIIISNWNFIYKFQWFKLQYYCIFSSFK